MVLTHTNAVIAVNYITNQVIPTAFNQSEILKLNTVDIILIPPLFSRFWLKVKYRFTGKTLNLALSH